MPLNDVSGVLKSPWASTQTTPIAVAGPAACSSPDTDPDGGRVITYEYEGAIPVTARRGDQAGGVRAEASDVQRSAAFHLQRGIEMCLMRTGETNAGGAQLVRQSRCQQGVRPGAKSFAALVIPVGNGHQINPHG